MRIAVCVENQGPEQFGNNGPFDEGGVGCLGGRD